MISNRTHRILFAAIIALAAFMLFANLGDRLLWQDEAETALLTRSIAERGIPKAWDGRNIITQQSGREFDDDFLWRWHGWGTPYMAYLSSRVFGETPFGFRFFGALFGLLTILATYLAAMRWTGNRDAALLACAILLISIPFLLHSRQCRYYSIISFLGTISIWAYAALPRRRAWFALVISTAVMAYFNELSCGSLAATLLAYAAISDRGRLRSILLALPAIAILCVPEIVLRAGPGGTSALLELGLPLIIFRLRMAVFGFNYVHLPLIAIAALWIFRGRLAPHTASLLKLVTIMFAACTLTVLPLTEPKAHYFTFAFVVAAMLIASALTDIWRQSRIAAVATAVIFFGTHTFSLVPVIGSGHWLATERVDFFRELTHHYRGPTEAVVEFLGEHAAAGDVVFTDYGQFPLMVHTDLSVAGLVPPERAKRLGLPDFTYDPMLAIWIVPRSIKCVSCPGMTSGELLEAMRSQGAKITGYPIDAPHLFMDSVPHLSTHRFTSPPLGKSNMIVFRVEWPEGKPGG